MRARRSRAEIEAELSAVQASLAEHPFNSEARARSNAIIESRKGDDPATVDAALRAEGLPGLADIGRSVVAKSLSFSRLHRRRRTLERRLAR